jgi:hypothetical protein
MRDIVGGAAIMQARPALTSIGAAQSAAIFWSKAARAARAPGSFATPSFPVAAGSIASTTFAAAVAVERLSASPAINAVSAIAVRAAHAFPMPAAPAFTTLIAQPAICIATARMCASPASALPDPALE